MKNLKGLASSSLDAFKADEIKNPLQIIGGSIWQTTYNTYDPQGHLLFGPKQDLWKTGPDAVPTGGASSIHWGFPGDMADFITGQAMINPPAGETWDFTEGSQVG